MRDVPLHPEPAIVLATALLQHDEDLAHAQRLAVRGANGYLNGDMRLCGDYSGALTSMMVPWVFEIAAKIAIARDDFAMAFAFARGSRALQTRTSARADETEAGIWERLERPSRAELAWTRALNAGSHTARQKLAELYERSHDSMEGFDTHLAKLIAKTDTSSRPRAAAFAGEDLDGRPLSLEKLRGRVVVLNFWGLGCAPCKAEIPDLSRMVASYRGKQVEFIAFATDEAGKLRTYLADHPFAYRVVAQAGGIAERYGVHAWPTHVIIDKRGRVAATFVGGGKNADQRFRPVIDRLLDE